MTMLTQQTILTGCFEGGANDYKRTAYTIRHDTESLFRIFPHSEEKYSKLGKRHTRRAALPRRADRIQVDQRKQNKKRRQLKSCPFLYRDRTRYDPPVAVVEFDIFVLTPRVLRAGVDAYDALCSGGQHSEIVGPVPRGAAHPGVV